jgi:gliding-associated putative ABC transporter substrate-binding component GldG
VKKRQNITTGLLLTTAIVIVVNIMSFSWFARFDFTKDKRYTLGSATLDILKDLKKTVTVTAYFSENLPPAISQARADLKDMLTEYAARSGNKVVYNFIDPNKNDTTEKDAMKNGINPVMVNIREKDQVKQQKAFLGAVIKMGEKTDVIPFMQPGAAMEYALSSSIKKLSIDKKSVVGLLAGQGEPPLPALQQVNETMGVMYDLQAVNLTDTSKIPSGINTLLLVDPKDTFRIAELNQLDAFLSHGGRMLITYSGLNGDLRSSQGKAVENGLRAWLAAKNIVIEPKFIIDAHCGSVTVRQQEGQLMFNNNVPFPFLPMIKNFSNHPISKGLSSVMFPFASAIKFTGDTNKIKYVVLATTSDKTGLKDAPLMFDIQHQWDPSEFPFSNLPVAAAFSGVNDNKDSRLVVITNGQFAVNGGGQQAQQLDADNINLFVNSVDWLSDDTGLIELRSKEVKSVPLKDISDSTKTLLKYLNFLLPILIVIGYGAVRMQVKRKLRLKRMEEIYE